MNTNRKTGHEIENKQQKLRNNKFTPKENSDKITKNGAIIDKTTCDKN